MFFTGFVTERGPPWRPCDYWDELYANMGDLLRSEAQDPRLLLVHIKVINLFYFIINYLIFICFYFFLFLFFINY